MKNGISKVVWSVLLGGTLFSSFGLADLPAKPRVEVRASVGFQAPRGSVAIVVGSDRYHYHRGSFYREGKRGYVKTRAPYGAVVSNLPRGYSRLVVGLDVYFRFDDVYYIRTANGYRVVEAPRESGGPVTVNDEVVTSSRAPLYVGYESIWLGESELLFKNGQFFEKTSEGLVWVEAPFGAVVAKLPSDSVQVWYEDVEYFDSDGVFFRKVPSGYKVVNTPWGVADPADS